MRRTSAKRKSPDAGPISAAVSASAEALHEQSVGPQVQDVDLGTISLLVSQPAWSRIGIDARLSFVILHNEMRGKDIGKIVAELLEDESQPPFEDTLVRMSQTRIALLQVAAMMKASLCKQWKALDAYLIANGLPTTQADDELCDDEELLALRPAFEEGRTKFKAATDAVAVAGRQYSEESRRMKAAYAVQNNAIDADVKLVDRVAALRARTKEGIQFKREVRDYWKDCEQPELDASIFVDLLAYVEASP